MDKVRGSYTTGAQPTPRLSCGHANSAEESSKVALFPGLHTAGVMAMTADTLVGFNDVLVILSRNSDSRNICSNLATIEFA